MKKLIVLILAVFLLSVGCSKQSTQEVVAKPNTAIDFTKPEWEITDKRSQLKATANPRTKFQKVETALAQNPNIVVVARLENNFLNGPDSVRMMISGDMAKEITFWVAPKDGIYDLDKLQNLMEGLVSDIKWDKRNSFYARSYRYDTVIYFGDLTFYDNVGKVSRSSKVSIKDKKLMVEFDGIQNNKTIEESYDLYVTTHIKVYPNTRLALMAGSGITSEDLERFK